MRRGDFSDDAWVTLAPIMGGEVGCVPRPLPAPIAWSGALVSKLSAADRAVATFAGIGLTLPNQHLLIRPFIRREAVLSSRIEGTLASLSDLLFFEAAPTAPVRRPDVVEVSNYVRALEFGLTRQAELPVSRRLMRELHERLMKGVRGGESDPGNFRSRQNWIGPTGCVLQDATYVPPPVDRMDACLDELERFIHAENVDTPPLLRIAMIHYQFEAVHPFLDGNGRVGRLLITLLLCIWELLPQPMLYLSAYFERHREEYYRRLLGVSLRGEWEAWLVFFLDGVAEQAGDARDRARQLMELRESLRGRFQKGGSARLPALIDYLFESPMINVNAVAEHLGVTFRAASQLVDKLVEGGVLTEVTGQSRNRVFTASEILAVVDHA